MEVLRLLVTIPWGNKHTALLYSFVTLFMLTVIVSCNFPVIDLEDDIIPAEETQISGDFEGPSSPRLITSEDDISSSGSEGRDRRPVGFINHGIFNATVRPWTWIPLGVDAYENPPQVSTVSTASTSPGLWPNPSRFLTLPTGTYTWCIEWDEGDIDDDGKIDYFYYIDDHPVTLDEDDSDDLDMAREVDISAPPSQAIVYPGTCGQATTQTGQSVRLIDGDIRSAQNPPGVFVYANPGYATRPEGFSVNAAGTTQYYEAVIFLFDNGWIEATNLVDINSIGVQFWGDNNDGWARVLLDGSEIWQGDTYGPLLPDPDSFVKYLEVSNLSPGGHTLRVEHMGMEGAGGGSDVTVLGFGFRLTGE